MIFAMCDFSRYLIRDNVTVREALIALNRLSNDTLVLFVIDRDRRLVGTLTDGDVRRGINRGFESGGLCHGGDVYLFPLYL